MSIRWPAGKHMVAGPWLASSCSKGDDAAAAAAHNLAEPIIATTTAGTSRFEASAGDGHGVACRSATIQQQPSWQARNLCLMMSLNLQPTTTTTTRKQSVLLC